MKDSKPAQPAEQPTVTQPIEAAHPEEHREEQTNFVEEHPPIIINNISYNVVVHNHNGNGSFQEGNADSCTHIYELDELEGEEDEYVNSNDFPNLLPLPAPNTTSTN